MGKSSEPEDLVFSNGEEAEDELEAPKGSLYITVEGALRLRAELKHLFSVERPKVTNEVSVAAAMGDRSENAEYMYGKKRLREIDRRMHFLQKRLEKLTVVNPTEQKDESKVYFGATVTLENDDDGTKVTYHRHSLRLSPVYTVDGVSFTTVEPPPPPGGLFGAEELRSRHQRPAARPTLDLQLR